MKLNLLKLCIGLVLSLFAFLPAHASDNSSGAEPARVTFTVLKFHPTAPNDKGEAAKPYTDAIAELAPHPFVTSSGDAIYPTFHPRKAVDFEIRVKSLDPKESYTPIAVRFEQKPRDGRALNDPVGALNFAPARLSGSALIFHSRFLVTRHAALYEFFIVIRRASDGAIGVIDPSIEIRSGD